MPEGVTIVQATPLRRTMTLRVVDAEGGLKAVSFPILGAGLVDTQFNDFIDAYGAATNAYVYEAYITAGWGSGIPTASSATDAPRVSVMDVVNVLFKSTLNPNFVPIRLEVLAPETAMIDGKIVDQDNPLLTTVVGTFNDLVAFAGLGIVPASYGFTERRKRNPRLPPL